MINKTLADQVYEKLENEILTGKYKRGEIITELSICSALGVSRTPVREALRRLEQDHIVESSGKGMTVLGITPRDVEIIYEIRSRIEGLAAAACAQNATDEQIAELREITELQEFYAGKRDSEKIKAMDSNFHEKLYQYSGSTVYYDTLMPLHRKIQKVRKRSVEDKSRAQISTEEHKKILNAIEARDTKTAEKAANEHVAHAREHLKSIDAFAEND